MEQSDLFGTEKISKILLWLPVYRSQLPAACYVADLSGIFQAVGSSLKSSLLTVIRTVALFVPLGYIFSRFGLTWFWMTFPVTETVTTLVGALFYRQFLATKKK